MDEQAKDQKPWVPQVGENEKGKNRFEYLLTILRERQETCRMEHDINKYGELQFDYNSTLREIWEQRAALDGSREGA